MSCAELLAQTQLAVGPLVRAARLKSAELQGHLFRQLTRLLALQHTAILALQARPFSKAELQEARRLLSLHRGMASGMQRMFRDVPETQHVRILREWAQLHDLGKAALDRLPPPYRRALEADPTSAVAVFHQAQWDCETADSAREAERALMAYQGCVQGLLRIDASITGASSTMTARPPAQAPEPPSSDELLALPLRSLIDLFESQGPPTLSPVTDIPPGDPPGAPPPLIHFFQPNVSTDPCGACREQLDAPLDAECLAPPTPLGKKVQPS